MGQTMQHFAYFSYFGVYHVISSDEPQFEFHAHTWSDCCWLPGNVVWLVAATGRRPRYALVEWFVVERVHKAPILVERVHNAPPPRTNATYRYLAEGNVGCAAQRAIAIGGERWFREMMRSLGQGALDPVPIPAEFVAHFYDVFRAAELPTPHTPPSESNGLADGAAPPGNQTPDRQLVVLSRINRDTAVTADVKRRHACRCQVCGKRLELTDGSYYAEGAHVRPLGAPYNGPDLPGNVLCLCPNDHVLFDAGAFSVSDELTLIGRPGRLRTAGGHRLTPEHLRHHRRRFTFERP
jgi:hypothetical protein